MGGQNRIVIDYGDYEGLVLLGTFDNNGKECDIDIWRQYGFDVVKKYDGIKDYNTLKSMIDKDREGYVIRFRNGFRMKIKGEEYVRLHRILTGFSNVDIWEYLKDGKDINELLDRVPDEFDKWVKSTIRDIKYGYFQVNERSGKLFDHKMYGKYNDLEPETDKKKYAEWVMNQEEILRPILFRMFYNKDYSDYIWKIIKPKYVKPIWSKND